MCRPWASSESASLRPSAGPNGRTGSLVPTAQSQFTARSATSIGLAQLIP